MSYDPGIICFQHCQKRTKVFAFQLPDICNFCKADLSNTELRIPPFRVPYPFKDASRETNTIVIKPTYGDFLNNYKNSSDLHIGVTDSSGCVFEYDSLGIARSSGEAWTQCLSISVIEHIEESFKYYWDKMLNDVFNQSCWTAERYDPVNYNCYSFVLVFLKSLQLPTLHPYLNDKTVFCEQYVSPQARFAAKYISLFRELKLNTTVVR